LYCILYFFWTTLTEALHSPPPVSVSVVPHKCGELTFKKSSKIGATRRQISKFTKVLQSKSISAGALPQTQLGELTVLPNYGVVFKGHNSKGREK